MRSVIQQQQRELLAAVRWAVKRFSSVREAAKFIGMPKSSFHDYCALHRIRFPRQPKWRRQFFRSEAP